MTKMPLIKQEITSENCDESLYELKPFQREALSKMNEGWEKNGLLSLPSGTGKTLIMGNYLKQRRLGLIIVLSPTKILTQQNLNRLSKFLPDYMSILVDSEGTRSTDYLQSLIDKQKKRLLLSSTYRSIDIIGDLDLSSYGGDDALLCIDECHNITSEIHDFIDVFPGKVLQLSATPIDILEEDSSQYDLQTIYHLEFSRAIQEKYITDYMIYIPSFLDSKSGLYVDIPDLDGYYAPRAEFLVCGMLRKGYKRCIVYLNTINDCRIFVDTIRRVFEEYHGEKFWGGIITENVSERNRQNILNEFSSKNNLETYRIIASVRILDEGLDIPCCDSIYFAEPSLSKSDYNYRRSIQRLNRATRIDRDNTNKIAGCFIYCEDIEETVNIIEILKYNDIDITKKINSIIMDYDKSYNNTSLEKEYNIVEEFNKYIISTMSLDDKWMQKYSILKEFILNNKRYPKKYEVMDNIEIGIWVCKQRNTQKKNKMSKRRELLLSILDGWRWIDNKTEKKAVDWETMYKLLSEFIVKNNRLPYKNEVYLKQNLGSWAYRQRHNKELSNDKHNKLEKIDKWYWPSEENSTKKMYTWDENYNLLVNFVHENDRLPKYNENNMGTWIQTQRHYYKHNQLMSAEKIKKLESIKHWKWGSVMPRYEWDNWYNLILEFINENNSIPKQNEIYKERKIGVWLNNQNKAYSTNNMTQYKIDKLKLLNLKWL